MVKYLYTLLFLFSCFFNSTAAPGDDCATAIPVSSNGCSNSGAYDNTGITGTLSAPSCFTTGNNNGMWYQFVASQRVVNIVVNGSTLTQPQIALLQPALTGCTGTFTELACNSSGTITATINYSNLTVGNSYYVYVDGRNNLVGSFQLCLSSPISPTNDNPCNPIVVPSNNFCSAPDAFTNIGASSENLFSTPPGCWTATGAYNTVFFQFTATGAYNTISVSGGLNSPQIAIISTANCNGSAWTNNGASNCASSNTNTVTMNANNLTPGQTYLIAVDGKIDNVGTFQLCVNSYAPTAGPPNDICSNATALCPNQFISGTTANATSSGDVDISRWSCNAVLDNPVWFKFVANTPVQPIILNINGNCSGDNLQVEVFRFTGTTPCAAGTTTQYTSIGCNNAITVGSATLTIPAANMVAGQTYYVLVDNWPGRTCDFSFSITGNAGADAGANQNICITQAPFNNVGIPAGGTWSGPGITNTTTGAFDPRIAGIGNHTLFYANGICTSQKIINVTGPQVTTSNDVTICGGSTQLLGSVNAYPSNILKQFTNNTNFAIPDNNATGISSVINVSGINPSTVLANPIQRVCININHPFDGDLDVYLICPGGAQIELTTDNGGGGDNYTNTCFVAGATSITTGTAPFTGNYSPEQPFTNLNACNINGNWTLRVIDDASSDIGNLLNWSIFFNQQNTTPYIWSPTTNMVGSTTLNPIVSPTTTTKYYLTATDANSCSAIDSVIVTVANSIAGPNQNICLNNSTSFTSSGAGTWAAIPGNPSVVTIQSVSNPTSNVGPFNTIGNYDFVWTSGICKDTVRISVIAPPIANAGVDKSISCTVPSVSIGTPAVAGLNYTWSPTIGLSNPNIAQPNATQPGTYTLIVTDPITTCFTTDDIIVTQTALVPVANAGTDKTLTCTTTSLSIGTAALTGINYSWSPTTGLSNANIAQPNATQPGTFTVTATNPTNGCSATDAVVVSQNITPPVANAGADKTLTCITTSVSIGTAAVAGINYSWSPTTGLSNANIAQPNATQSGTFTVTATNPTNGCSATDAVVISQIIALPVADAGTDRSLTCTTSSLSIGTAAVTGINYSWSPTTGLSNANIAQPNATQPGTFTVTATNPTNGCSATDAVVVSQNITPPVANAGADKSLTCITTSVSIGTAAVAGINYSWSPTTGLSNANIAQPNATQPGTFTVTATNPTNGCSATDAVVVSQNITPPITNAGADRYLTCTTTSLSIGTAAVAGINYSWSPTTGLSNANIAQPNATQPGTFTITATNPTNGCSATDAVVVSQNIIPPVANAGADKSLTCITTSVSIGTAAVAGINYSWSPTTGLSNPNIAQPNATQPGTFTVTATNPTNGCSATDAVVVSQNITPPVANAGADKSLTCTTSSLSIGTAAVAGINYSWSPTTGLSNPNIAQPNATQPGTFTVTATNPTNGCSATDAVVVSQNITPPSANAGADKSLTCTTSSLSIGTAAVAGINYSWSPTTGLSNPNIAQPNATQPGTFTVTATNPTNGCSATDAVVVSQNITPPVANAGADKSLTCITTSVSIGTAAVAGINYSWSPTTGLSNPNIAQPNATQTGTFTVTATNPTNGCSATDAVVVSQNITPPVANAGADKSLTCTTTSVSIGTATVAGINYSWSPTTGLSNPNIAQPNATQTGTFTVTATNPTNGCSATDAVVVSQNIIPPTANAGADKSLTCTTTSLSIGTAAVAGINYSWSPTTGLSNANIAQPNATQPGTFTVTATNPTNGCSATDAVVVSQNITPPVANAGADKSLTCTTSSLSIGTAAVAGINYSWSPTTGLSNPNIAQPNATQPGTFTVTATNPTNGCSATDAVVVSQNITPPVANAGADKSLTCTTTSVSIGTAAVAGINYSWSPTTGLSNPNIAQPNATQPGTFTVTATNPTNGCSATDAVVISQNIIPPTANAGADKSLTCTTTSLSIGTAAFAGINYSWSPTTGLSNANIAQPNATQPGTFTVTATNPTNGCSATDAVVVSQNITSPIANAGADKSLTCTTSSLSIGTAAVAGINYSWSPTTGLSNPNIAQPNATQPGTFTVTATNPTNGCSATDAVVVSQNITPPVANAGADKSLTCTTTSVSIGTAAVAGINYSWSPTTGLSNPNIAQPNATQPGTFTVTATNPTNGCSATDAVVISQNITPPLANAGADNTLTCVLNSVPIGSLPISGINYTWTPRTGLSNPNIANPIASDSAKYIVTAVNPANGCISKDTVLININRPYTDIELGPDKTIYQEESVAIEVAGINDGIFNWTPTSTLSCGNCFNPIANPLITTTYYLTYKNKDECITLDTIIVNVIPIVGLFFPDAFSPNGDNINDLFFALGDSVKSYELNIFNRWGELIFTTYDRDGSWDGFYKGEEQPVDSYIYVAHATLYNNKKKTYKGAFSLLK